MFFGVDRPELELFQNIEERLVTQGDLQQFLEAVLAAVRDNLHSAVAFIAALDDDQLSLIVTAGNRSSLDQQGLTNALELFNNGNGGQRHEFVWGRFWVLPLHQRKRADMDRDEVPPFLGVLGVAHNDAQSMDPDQREALWLLAERAALALEDRRMQQRLFSSLQDLQPQVDMIQRMRAAGRYDFRAGLAERGAAAGV